MKPEGIIKSAVTLRKQGRTEEALKQLRDALRRELLDAEEIEQAGRFIRKEIVSRTRPAKPLSVLLLGQCTTSWLVSVLTAVAWGQNVEVLVSEGGYDNIIQDLSAPTLTAQRPDVVVLLPWNQRLFSPGSARERMEDEVSFWQQTWELVGRHGSRLLQVGYDWMTPCALGHHLGGRRDGHVNLVRRVNAMLQEQLPSEAYFLDLEQVSGTIGRLSFYDPRRYHWTKQPFSELGTHHLAKHLWAGVRALSTGPKKVLVIDLDNTLWGGVVGERGPLGVALGDSAEGDAYRSLQTLLKELTRRGVLLAVASKNNPDDAREVFERNPDMVLRQDDFAAFEACWDPKGVMIERIAQALNLGLDSFVFLDDNPAEREQVRQALPEVEVVEVSLEPAEYARALHAGLWFEAADLTQADRERVGQYVVERQRRELQQSFSSLEDYLRSLEMRAEVREIEGEDLQRVVQLLAKTNQFNLTTRRHTQGDVLDILALPNAIHLTLRLRDRFGDHGLVALMLGVPAEEDGAIRIDTWLMSCRVIGRTVEHFFLSEFLARARTLGYQTVIGEYVPTKKNAQVSTLYEELDFDRLPDRGDGVIRYKSEIEAGPKPVTFVLLTEPALQMQQDS